MQINNRIYYCIMYIFIITVLITNAGAQESSNYLESAIEELKNMNSYPSQRKSDTGYAVTQKSIPTLSLTKQDLAKLYETAVQKGDSVKLNSDSGPQLDAAVYEINENTHTNHEDHKEDSSGYYYYYYPLKSFMDELTSGHHDQEPLEPSDTYRQEVVTTKPFLQYHTHTHEHNIHITESKHDVDGQKKPKGLEPLFMAISGFIGMTVMFVLSILLLPKLGVLKSRGGSETTSEITSVAKIVLQAIDGYDCTDRFACELGKTAKALNIHNNRFVKLIRRITPASFSKRLTDIDKYASKKYKCATIQCVNKTTTSKNPAKQKKTKS